MVQHALELRQDHPDSDEEARVGYRLNQTHGKACGVTVDITSPSSHCEATEIVENTDGTAVA